MPRQSPDPAAMAPIRDQPPVSNAAPWFSVPDRQFVCVEHPARIRDMKRALATVGGEKALAKLVETNGESGLDLRMRPQDPYQPPIHSRTVQTSNVLLKISIPKRRRKKSAPSGSSADAQPESTESTLFHRLEESQGKYNVEALGTITTTVRFRDIADYQYSTVHSEFANKFKSTLMDCDYDNIRKFRLESDDPKKQADIFPPPMFSRTIIPHAYNYHQNPAVKRAIIDGQATLLNLQAAPKTLTTMVHISTPEIPTGPPENTPDISTLDRSTVSCIEHLKVLFAERPIWTRRALVNNFPPHLQPMIRFSMVHVAYMWRAGPWRDTCVIYGVDPRDDPKYRHYQSLFFQFEVDSRKKIRDAKSHIFDGHTLVKDGRCFQLCDITDPLLQSLIDRPKIRKKCHPQDGWYRSGTIIKIKGIMRHKIRALVEDGINPGTEAKIAAIMAEESDEDEEGNQNPKTNFKKKNKKGGKPGAPHQSEENRAEAPSGSAGQAQENANDDEHEGEGEEEDDGERAEDHEWEEGGSLLESEWTTETVDRRVEEFMELMKQGNDDDDNPLNEDGFDILEGSSGDEA